MTARLSHHQLHLGGLDFLSPPPPSASAVRAPGEDGGFSALGGHPLYPHQPPPLCSSNACGRSHWDEELLLNPSDSTSTSRADHTEGGEASRVQKKLVVDVSHRAERPGRGHGGGGWQKSEAKERSFGG